MKLSLSSVAFLMLALPAYATDYCADMSGFATWISDEVNEGNYELGHTSGYNQDAAGSYYYKYCITNLSDQTMFEFKWNGPRPNMLLRGRVAYGQSYTEGWGNSSSSPDENDERVLQLGNGNSYHITDNIQTIFRSAASRSQSNHSDLDMRSWPAFIQGLRNRPLADAIYRQTAGVRFSIPSDPSDWDAFIGGSEAQPESAPIQMQVYLGLEYDLEKLEIRLISSAGVIPSDVLTERPSDLLKELRLEFPELARAGFEVNSIGFENTDQQIVNIDSQYHGFIQSEYIASLNDLLNEERPVPIIDVPIILTLSGNQIFEFPLEALGMPLGN